MDDAENITMEIVEETITYIEDVPIELHTNTEEPAAVTSEEEPAAVIHEEEPQEIASIEPVESNILPTVAPKLIFVVPYRDREQHQRFFRLHMKNILSDYSEDEYKIIRTSK
jgi:hypothetical protein